MVKRGGEERKGKANQREKKKERMKGYIILFSFITYR
jgi:hypothetical protein